jgi:hypothetical protein
VVLVRADRPAPGVTRQQRISDEGLQRLEKQLSSGLNISAMVLKQWVKHYGDAARDQIRKHDRYTDNLDD